MDPENFRFSTSFFLCLPFPNGPWYSGNTYNDALGYFTKYCKHHSKWVIDANGNHAASCTQCHWVRQVLHKSLNVSAVYFLKKAGFITTYEPSLKMLLGPLDSNTSRLFPKRASKLSKLHVTQAKELLSSTADKSKEGQMHALNTFIGTLPDVPNSDLGAIRPDFLAVPEDGKGSSFCGDFTSIHPTASSYIKDALADLVIIANNEIELFGDGLSSRIDSNDQKIIAEAVNRKNEKYALIAELANLRGFSKNASKKMVFVPAVVTHHGQLNYELFSFIENCTLRYRRIQREVVDIDGLTLQQRVSDFRVGFKNSLIFSLASNWGNQLKWGVLRGSVK